MDFLWKYFLIFTMAATPWLEILIVIPIGLGWGLMAIPVAIVSFIGNLATALILIIAYEGLEKWWKNRKAKEEPGPQVTEDSQGVKETKRSKRGKEILRKYGLPGLALVSPLLTGAHLAILIALSLKMDKRGVAFWMTISLALWTIFITIATYYGIEGINWLLR